MELIYLKNIIDSFSGEHRYLSNFYESSITYKGNTFRNSEAAFQAEKCINEVDKKQFIGLNASEAKRLGRRISMRRDWDDIKVGIMKEIVENKFKQNKILLDKLVNTGDTLIVEGNTWHDNFWGNCTCGKCFHIVGKNNLGIILMEIRDSK